VSPEGPKTLVGATEIYKHKPLGADEIAQIERDSSFSEETGSSAWNKGGTWEEKDYSKWAEARIKEVLLSIALFLNFVFFRLNQVLLPAALRALRARSPCCHFP
jgi:hypothetical protein